MANYILSRSTITYLDVSTFKPEEDAQKLKDAMKGTGTNHAAIIDILGSRTNEQRQAIKEAYMKLFEKNLMDALKDELKGEFEDLIVALMTPTAEYDAQLIDKSIRGWGTDEDLLMEVLFTRTRLEMHNIKQAYCKLFGHDMVGAVEGDTSSGFRKFCVILISRGGDHDVDLPVNQVQVKRDAEALYKGGQGKLGTDEAGFFNMLTCNTYAHLRAVFDEYQKVHKSSIEDTIKCEFGGDAQWALLGFVGVIRSTEDFFAKILHKSITSKDDKTTTRIIVTRSEIDLADIKEAYHRLYKKGLPETIDEHVTGPTRVMLKALIG